MQFVAESAVPRAASLKSLSEARGNGIGVVAAGEAALPACLFMDAVRLVVGILVPSSMLRGGSKVGGGRSCVSHSGLHVHVHVCLSAVPVIVSVRHDCVLVFSLPFSFLHFCIRVSSHEHRLAISEGRSAASSLGCTINHRHYTV